MHTGSNILRSAKREQANWWPRREGTNTGASYFEVKSKPMVVVPQGHDNAGKLFVRSKPTAVTANKGVDIAGELIMIIVKESKPNGSRATRA